MSSYFSELLRHSWLRCLWWLSPFCLLQLILMILTRHNHFSLETHLICLPLLKLLSLVVISGETVERHLTKDISILFWKIVGGGWASNEKGGIVFWQQQLVLVVCRRNSATCTYSSPLLLLWSRGRKICFETGGRKSSVTSVQEACSDLALYTKGLCGDLYRFLLAQLCFTCCTFGLVAFTWFVESPELKLVMRKGSIRGTQTFIWGLIEWLELCHQGGEPLPCDPCSQQYNFCWNNSAPGGELIQKDHCKWPPLLIPNHDLYVQGSPDQNQYLLNLVHPNLLSEALWVLIVVESLQCSGAQNSEQK